MEELVIGLISILGGGLLGRYLLPRTVVVPEIVEVKVEVEHVPDPRLEWFDTAWKDKQRENAKTIAKAYIEENRSNLQRFENMTLEDLVQNIDAARRLGNEEERILTDMWLLSEYEPQNIEGSIRMGRED